MANIIKANVGDLVSSYFVKFGKELNSNRALPLIYDGLKPSYRRVLYNAIKAPGNHIKTIDLVGTTYKMHPHGDKSIAGTINSAVRYGLMQELANFGSYPIYGEIMSPAAPRYTETGVEQNWYDIISPMIDYVPFIQGEVEGVWEPKYLPTPIPICLVTGSIGLGIGINTNIPNFSPKSILDAYLNNDPSRLKPHYDLEIDYENSELERLWRTGTGKIIYKYHLEKAIDDDGCQGVIVSGDTQVFIPDWTKIQEWKDQGLLFIRNESTGKTNRIFIGKNKNIRKISQDTIYNECVRCTKSNAVLADIQTIYRLGVYDGTISRYIPMYNWIDFCYKNYIQLIEHYKQKNIDRLNFDTLVYTYLKQVAEILLNTKDDISNEDIASKLNISVDVVAAIVRKSISTLKRTDTNKMLEKINSDINYYQSLDAQKYAKNIINKM